MLAYLLEVVPRNYPILHRKQNACIQSCKKVWVSGILLEYRMRIILTQNQKDFYVKLLFAFFQLYLCGMWMEIPQYSD